MTREKLLSASVKSYQDKENKAHAYMYKVVNTADGYSYIAIDYKTKREITCAIHLGTDKETFQFGGVIPNTFGVLSTRDKLHNNEVVSYKDYLLFWQSFVQFNETMGQYSYDVRVLPPNDKILLSKMTQAYSNTCFDKISPMPNYTLLPNHADLRDEVFKDETILMECSSNRSFNPVTADPFKKVFSQQRVDDVIFTLYNMPRQKAMKFMVDLQEFSLSSQDFGFIELPYIVDETYINEFNATKSLISKIYTKISYNLTSNYEADGSKFIRTILYKCHNIDYLEKTDGKEQDETN